VNDGGQGHGKGHAGGKSKPKVEHVSKKPVKIHGGESVHFIPGKPARV
jgi:hypothetical protein